MKHLKAIIATAVLLAYAAAGIQASARHHEQIVVDHVKLQTTAQKLEDLQQNYQAASERLRHAEHDKNASQAKLRKLQEQKAKLEVQQEQLQKQLTVKHTSGSTVYAATVADTENCGSDPYMAYIYMVESHCRPTAENEIGACGLGQALPCGKMSCGAADWSCQDGFFRRYAVARYGSIKQAYLFRLSHNWW